MTRNWGRTRAIFQQCSARIRLSCDIEVTKHATAGRTAPPDRHAAQVAVCDRRDPGGAVRARREGFAEPHEKTRDVRYAKALAKPVARARPPTAPLDQGHDQRGVAARRGRLERSSPLRLACRLACPTVEQEHERGVVPDGTDLELTVRSRTVMTPQLLSPHVAP